MPRGLAQAHPELGEDLLLLQLLELLEYADLSPLALLPELTEVVRALKAYSDKDVAETAERVVLLLEELQTSESIAKEDRRRAKEKQRSERLHLRAVKAADHVSARAAKGGKRKGAAAAPRSQQRQRREKDEVVVVEEEEEEKVQSKIGRMRMKGVSMVLYRLLEEAHTFPAVAAVESGGGLVE